MPQFDAESCAEPLRVRLLPHADFDDIVEEPSDTRIRAFMRGIKVLMKGLQAAVPDLPADATPDQQAAALDALDDEEYGRAMDGMAALHSDLCSGRPTVEQLLALPLRKRLLFYNWLQKEVMSPEAATPAGNGQVKILPQRLGA